jgi:outer membrane protein assembly factor BamB
LRTLVFLLLLGAGANQCGAEEWPKWLGPNGDNISTEPIAAAWPSSSPQKLWEQKVGYGYASPIAVDGRVYLFYQAGTQDTLTAFNADSGKPLWSQGYTCGTKADRANDKNPDNEMPVVLATPTIDHGQIFSYGAGGDLVCRKLDDGSLIWHINILHALSEKILGWAQASSPLVTDKLVYVQGGDGGPTAAAIDRQTGRIAWTSEARTYGGYAACIIADVKGSQQLIVFGGEECYGMDPATGKTYWSVPFQDQPKVSAATPLYHDGRLFIACDYNRKPGTSMMLELGVKSAKVIWENSNIAQKFQPGVLDRGYYYTNSEGILKCMNWTDGKIMWENNLRLGSGGSVVRNGDKLIVMSERGKLFLIEATPSVNRVISSVQLFDFSQTWSSPLIYHGRLYCMGKDNLVCLDIANHTAMGPMRDLSTALR